MINELNNILFLRYDIIAIIKIDFLNYIKTMIFKNLDIMIRIILY